MIGSVIVFFVLLVPSTAFAQSVRVAVSTPHPPPAVTQQFQGTTFHNSRIFIRSNSSASQLLSFPQDAIYLPTRLKQALLNVYYAWIEGQREQPTIWSIAQA